MGLLLALLLAAPASHRATAARAEVLGHMQEAAREYEAAWTDEHAPDLLYRLGLVRRKLKRYGLAREAFRAYLREAPDGGLRDEVERQLARLEVLIEAQAEDYLDPAPKPARRPAATTPATPAPIPPSPPAAVQSTPPAAQTSPPAAVQPSSPAAQTSLPAAAPPSSPADARPSVPAVAQPALPAPAQPSPPAAKSAPGDATAKEPASASTPARSRVAPWLIGGAAAATAAGAYFWYDSSRLSRDLDARFASGNLSAADRPSYSRARTESVAGLLLLGAAAALAAGAIVLWW